MAKELGTHSIITIPLRAGTITVGVMQVARQNADLPSFTESDAMFYQEVADRATLAYSAAQLTLDLQAELTQRKSLEEERVLMTERLRELTSHLQDVREEERKRIAREIHDELGQQLTSVKIRLDYFFRKDPEGELAKERSTISREMEGAIRTVRKIATDLRPGILDSLGLSPALEWLVRDFSDKTGIECMTAIEEIPVGDTKAITIFRIAQEAITNVVRHAKASRVWVNFYMQNETLHLEVIDDGIGFSEAALYGGGHFGLVGMRERAMMAGGSLIFVRPDSGGTQVELRLPRGSFIAGGT